MIATASFESYAPERATFPTVLKYAKAHVRKRTMDLVVDVPGAEPLAEETQEVIAEGLAQAAYGMIQAFRLATVDQRWPPRAAIRQAEGQE